MSSICRYETSQYWLYHFTFMPLAERGAELRGISRAECIGFMMSRANKTKFGNECLLWTFTDGFRSFRKSSSVVTCSLYVHHIFTIY